MPKTRESNVELFAAVQQFMTISGQSKGRMDARLACLYTGLQLEELGEKIEAIVHGTLTADQADHLLTLLHILKFFAKEFKAGLHEGAILRANHADLIDADFDTAWVSIGALIAVSPDPQGAIAHGTFTNMDKIRDGVCVKDANGKIQKPGDWQKPVFDPYVDQLPKV